MEWIISTDRLNFRKITKEDFTSLCTILQDIEIMYAWEHAFTDDEVWQWIDNNLARYEKDGFSYFAAVKKNTSELVGVIGPLIETVNEKSYTGIAYILDKKHWGKGYALEGARACMDYAFDSLNADKVIAEIRPNNPASCRIAKKLGMEVESEFVKHYNNTDMVHLIYSRKKQRIRAEIAHSEGRK